MFLAGYSSPRHFPDRYWPDVYWPGYQITPEVTKRGVPGARAGRAAAEHEDTLRMVRMDRIMKDDAEVLKVIKYALSEIL